MLAELSSRTTKFLYNNFSSLPLIITSNKYDKGDNLSCRRNKNDNKKKLPNMEQNQYKNKNANRKKIL